MTAPESPPRRGEASAASANRAAIAHIEAIEAQGIALIAACKGHENDDFVRCLRDQRIDHELGVYQKHEEHKPEHEF